MIIPDLNLLVYAYNAGAADHPAAKAWWQKLIRSGIPIGIPWIVILGFIRLSTTRGVFAAPAAPTDALQKVEEWLAEPNVGIVSPGDQHLSIFRRTFTCTPGGPLTTDAHLAALAIEHQAELHSNDADFSRFSGLRWRNPL
jgi:toxin-antitoxin system PIN domain toxin